MSTSLAEAKERVIDGMDKGVTCPCCGRLAKVYNRKLNSIMAYTLIMIYQYFRKPEADKWLHVRKHMMYLRVMSNDYEKLEAWGLIEHKKPTEGEQFSGLWKITTIGKLFALGRCSVPKRIQFFNGKAMEESDEQTDITKALGSKFNYYELMKAIL